MDNYVLHVLVLCNVLSIYPRDFIRSLFTCSHISHKRTKTLTITYSDIQNEKAGKANIRTFQCFGMAKIPVSDNTDVAFDAR